MGVIQLYNLTKTNSTTPILNPCTLTFLDIFSIHESLFLLHALFLIAMLALVFLILFNYIACKVATSELSTMIEHLTTGTNDCNEHVANYINTLNDRIVNLERGVKSLREEVRNDACRCGQMGDSSSTTVFTPTSTANTSRVELMRADQNGTGDIGDEKLPSAKWGDVVANEMKNGEAGRECDCVGRVIEEKDTHWSLDDAITRFHLGQNQSEKEEENLTDEKRFLSTEPSVDWQRWCERGLKRRKTRTGAQKKGGVLFLDC